MISAMVDMYSKCGNLTYARRIFLGLSVLYNVMMVGYAHHGYGKEAIRLLEEILEGVFRPVLWKSNKLQPYSGTPMITLGAIGFTET